jgi:hypothetical protein
MIIILRERERVCARARERERERARVRARERERCFSMKTFGNDIWRIAFRRHLIGKSTLMHPFANVHGFAYIYAYAYGLCVCMCVCIGVHQEQSTRVCGLEIVDTDCR